MGVTAGWSAEEWRLPLILSSREKEGLSSTTAASACNEECHKPMLTAAKDAAFPIR